jgi:hypothetical protein
MKLKLIRKTFTETSTIGELFIDDKFECFILEDKERGLKQSLPLDDNKEMKVYAATAIPYGKYTVAITFSNRFKQYLPLLINVPAFEGIRIHSGNTADHTEGCLLPGVTMSRDMVQQSKTAFKALFTKLKAVEKTEKITIEIS